MLKCQIFDLHDQTKADLSVLEFMFSTQSLALIPEASVHLSMPIDVPAIASIAKENTSSSMLCIYNHAEVELYPWKCNLFF